MRRFAFVGAAFAALLLATPAVASAAPAPNSSHLTATTASDGGWVRVPSPPFTIPAGVLCDFAIHGDPLVDEVVKKVLDTYPDGSPKREAYKGALVYRVTNTSNGKSYDADASGSAILDYHSDGSQTWYVIGPVLAGFREGHGNLPRGLYVIDGLYTLQISSTRDLTVTLLVGTEDNVCAHIA
jgi:hypothetical protein